VLDTPYDEDIGAGYELRGGLFLCSRATTPREERDARVWRVTLVGGAVLQVRAVDLFRDGDEVVFTTPSDTFPSANTFVASLPASSVAVIDGERHPYPPSDSTPAADAP
jgi:hypothetical protein